MKPFRREVGNINATEDKHVAVVMFGVPWLLGMTDIYCTIKECVDIFDVRMSISKRNTWMGCITFRKKHATRRVLLKWIGT